jgi:hypothetical protein
MIVHYLGDLSDEVVFIGGVVAELLQTKAVLPKPRATDDVDAVAGITSRKELERFSEELRKRGFHEDSREGAPVCRWLTPNGMTFDLVPVEPGLLGFGNTWDRMALETAEIENLDADTTIRRVTGPVFLAMKWEAFHDRGGGDWYASRDVEDVIGVIAARPEIIGELSSAAEEVRTYVALQCAALLARDDVDDILRGALSSSANLDEVVDLTINRLKAISGK